MKIVETSAGPVEARALTAKEIRGGREHGLRYFGLPTIEDNFEAVRDYCIGCVLGEDAVDAMSNADQNRVFSAILAETWAPPGEEKNF